MKFLGEYVGKGLLAFFISLVLVWIVYFLNTYAMPQEKLPEIINHYFNKNATALEVNTKSILFSLNRSAITRPLAVYFFGVARVFQRVAGGNVTYYFGQIDVKGFLSYFPVVFLMKMTIPSLLLIFSASAIGVIKSMIFIHNHFRTFPKSIRSIIRNHPSEIALLLFIALYALSSIVGRLNIGIRHLFPIFPFIFILTAATIASAIRKTHDRKEKSAFYLSLIFLFVFLVIEIFSVYPYYLSYFNPAVGGPKNGYHYVTDSNADWGQDLKRLVLFLDQHPEIDKLKFNYFGLADPNYYLGEKYANWWDSKRPIEAGWYGISTLFLQESLFDTKRSDSANYSWLKNKKPAYQVGTSILIYYIPAEEAVILNGPAF